MDRVEAVADGSANRRPGAPMMEFITQFFRGTGLSGRAFDVCPIPGDGSRRVFWRVCARDTQVSYIAMENVPDERYAERENHAYLRIGRHLLEKGLPVPKIHRADLARGWFLLEDLGETNLQQASRRDDPIPLYEKVLEVLLRLQIEGAEGFNPEWTCQTQRYDRSVMRRYEADYFTQAFLGRYLGLREEWPELSGPFDFLAEKASEAPSDFFLHRDFQSRNIMVSEKGIGILDWQGARLGPLAYDVASLVIDPYTDLTHHERNRVCRRYIELLRDRQEGWLDSFEESYPYLSVQRNLQILGAFAYLSRAKGKTYFESYIPRALTSLHTLLCEMGKSPLAPIQDLVGEILRKPLPVPESSRAA